MKGATQKKSALQNRLTWTAGQFEVVSASKKPSSVDNLKRKAST